MIRMISFATAILALILPPAAKGQETKPASAQTVVQFAQNGSTALNWATFVALDKGFLQQEGIRLEVNVFADPTTGIQSVVSNSVDLGVVAPDTMILAAQNGADLKIIAGTVGAPPWSFVTRPEVKRFADLKGKRLGSSALTGNVTAVLKKVLEANGVKSADYDLLVVRGTSARYAALSSGGISGALLAQPLDIQAVEAGFNRLAFGPDIVQHYQTEVIYGRGGWVRDHRDVVERVLRALIAASAWLYDPANKAEAVSILAKNTKSTSDLAEQTYGLYFATSKILPRQLEIDIEGLNFVIQAMVDDKELQGPTPKPSDFVDTSFLEKVRR